MRARLLDRKIYLRIVESDETNTSDSSVKAVTRKFQSIGANLFDQKTVLIVQEYQAHSRLTLTFHLHAASGVKPGDEILFEGRSFEVVSIRDVARPTTTELVVQSRPHYTSLSLANRSHQILPHNTF